MKKVIFTLAEARSGTLYLRNLFRLNARDCACRHETFFDIGNPTMFGPAIYDAYAGRLEKSARAWKRSATISKNLPGSAYIRIQPCIFEIRPVSPRSDFFPDLHLIHLVRNPLKVAASEAYREMWRRRRPCAVSFLPRGRPQTPFRLGVDRQRGNFPEF